MNGKKTLFWIVGLIGAYVACQMIADIGASKLISLGSVVIPGGTFVFAFTFTIRDMIHKRLGREWAVAAIWTAGLVNVFMALNEKKVAAISFPTNEGRMDYRGFVSEDKAVHKWAKDLFEYYWTKSKPKDVSGE